LGWNRNSEFEEVLEEAEVWYLTYISKIGKEAEEIKNNSTQIDSAIHKKETSEENVIHLFKNLSPTSDADTSSEQQVESDEANEPVNSTDDEIITAQKDSVKAKSIEPSPEVKENDLASELDSETIFDDDDIEEGPELNVAEHLPDSIIPGVWLEIYQGEDKAKRRLKFSKAIPESNHLIFSDRSGDYSLEIDLQTFLDDLSTGKSSLISESNRFDLALSSVISNIRSSQDEVDAN